MQRHADLRIDERIGNGDSRPLVGEQARQRERRRMAGVADVFAIARAKDENTLAGKTLRKSLLEQGDGRGGHPVVDRHGGGRERKLEIRQTEYVLRRHATEQWILAEAIAADAQARITDVLMRRPNPDRLQHFEQIDVDAPRELLP